MQKEKSTNIKIKISLKKLRHKSYYREAGKEGGMYVKGRLSEVSRGEESKRRGMKEEGRGKKKMKRKKRTKKIKARARG